MIYIFLFLILFVNSFYPKIKILNIISDFKDNINLYDENYNTLAIGKAGSNSIILQLGAVRYISELKIYLDQVYSIDKILIYKSDNFVIWEKILENNNIISKNLEIQFIDLATLFLKIIVITKDEIKIKEIELNENSSPPNEIYNIKVENITENTVSIRWNTKNISQDYFYFEKKFNGELQSIVEVGSKTNHNVELKNLLPGSEYIFYIVSESPDGKRIRSDFMTFKTKGIPFPEIIELKALNITPYNAKLYYLANVPVSYELFFGNSTNSMNKILEEKTLKLSNIVDIIGLQQEMQYYFKILLKDKRGNIVITPIIDFFTPPDNIALGKKVIGTFNNIDTEISNQGFGLSTVEKVVDGNLNYFGGMAISFNPDNSDQYVIIDLENKELIKRIEIYWWGLGFSKNYRIDFSFDGVYWETIIDKLDAEKGVQMRSPAGDLLIKNVIQVNKQSRFVRIFIPAGSKRGTLDKKWEPFPYLYLNEVVIVKGN